MLAAFDTDGDGSFSDSEQERLFDAMGEHPDANGISSAPTHLFPGVDLFPDLKVTSHRVETLPR